MEVIHQFLIFFYKIKIASKRETNSFSNPDTISLVTS